MHTAEFLFYNGTTSRTGKPLISPDNRSFRYGDGCFETMALFENRLCLSRYHFERLFTSLDTLGFELPAQFTPAYLEKQIHALAAKNGHAAHARVRLTVCRGDGGLYDPENHYPNHLIQTWKLENTHQLNENGLVVGVFQAGRKVCDHFSSIKSNNYLCYAMAALWAKSEKLNEAILLNPFDRLADATIANVFVVKDGTVVTPALTEGAVNGVMRRHLLQCMRTEHIPVLETELTAEDLLQASEVFLTNAIHGIRWVRQMGESSYTNQLARHLYQTHVKPLYQHKP